MKKMLHRLKNLIYIIIIPTIALLCLLAILMKGLTYFSHVNEAQSKELLEQSVRKATIECYAIEGVYPSDLSYLEENYGVIYNKNKYGVEYGFFASNIMPTIVVYEK